MIFSSIDLALRLERCCWDRIAHLTTPIYGAEGLNRSIDAPYNTFVGPKHKFPSLECLAWVSEAIEEEALLSPHNRPNQLSSAFMIRGSYFLLAMPVNSTDYCWMHDYMIFPRQLQDPAADCGRSCPRRTHTMQLEWNDPFQFSPLLAPSEYPS
jgi:hypothetical protein